MIMVALDPSIRSSGLAVFRDGVLVQAERVRAPKCDHWAPQCMGAELYRLVCIGDPDLLVSEFPQIYRAGKSKGDPNDQLGMAAVVGAFSALLDCEVVTYQPRWMSLKKSLVVGEAFTSPRGKRIMGRLSPAEAALVPKSHDAVDAVGIGLHHLGRLAPRRVYPGAE